MLIAVRPSQEAGISQVDHPASSEPAKESVVGGGSLARETQSPPLAALAIMLSQGNTEKHLPTPPHQSITLFVQDQPSDLGSHNSIPFQRGFPAKSLRLLPAAKSPACKAFNLRGRLRLHQVGYPARASTNQDKNMFLCSPLRFPGLWVLVR